MGACVSSDHKSSSVMKVHVSSTSTRKPDCHVAIVPAPVKQKLPVVNAAAAVKPHLLHEEMFFDSQAWLDSDCESDFMSVNGEFTPSIANTPVHHNFSTGPRVPAIDNHTPSIPVKNTKRLSELFSESQREGGGEVRENGAVESLEVAVVHGGVVKLKKERWVEIVQVHGCLPRVQTEVKKRCTD
ncbi:uncharacterized protein At3g27210-like [Bidens hawaiensis]|uniref:uncharacterized protein At3g27210-like n=1 Tax=Bidens hawaiensis TaxID=980011 RepID=UPI0040491DC9